MHLHTTSFSRAAAYPQKGRTGGSGEGVQGSNFYLAVPDPSSTFAAPSEGMRSSFPLPLLGKLYIAHVGN